MVPPVNDALVPSTFWKPDYENQKRIPTYEPDLLQQAKNGKEDAEHVQSCQVH